ncbi:MAG: CapA family protein [Dehalococcoidia bacterium]
MKRSGLLSAALLLAALPGCGGPGEPVTREAAASAVSAGPGFQDTETGGGPVTVVVPAIASDLTSVLTLAAVGDVMLARSVGQAVLREGPSVVFAGVREVLAGADIAVANLETAIAESGEPAAKSYRFRAPPPAAGALADAGIDVVGLANNHTLDYGTEALSETLSSLDSWGVAHAGAGMDASAAHKAATVMRHGLRVAFLSYVDVPAEGTFNRVNWDASATRPGVAWFDEAAMRDDVAVAREGADLVVVLLHFGPEGSSTPSATQRAQARAAIDAGAALVIGSHPHVLQPVEEYNGGVIAYSLGNFVFDGFEGHANETAIFVAELTRDGVRSWRLVPASIGFDGLPVLTGE